MAQISRILPGDTVRTPVYDIRGVTVLVARPSSTTGGASAIEISLDSIMALPAPTLEQVLREVPLIQIRQNSRGEAQPALRGAEDRQVAVLMDGVPITLGWDARTDLSVIPLTAAQRVSVVRGLSSVLLGPNVLGGAVEVDVARGARRQQAPRPLQVDLAVDHTGARSVGVTGGRLLGARGGEWVLRAGAGHQGREGYAVSGRAGRGDGQDRALLTRDGDLRLNTDLERLDGFLSARFLSPRGSWISFSSSGFTLSRGVAPEAHMAAPRLWRYPRHWRLISAFSAGTGMRATPFGEGKVEASAGVDVGHFRIHEFASADYREVSGGEDGDDGTLTFRLLADHTLGERGELRGAFTYGDVTHEESFPGSAASRYRQRLWSLGTEAEWIFGSLLGLPGTRVTRLTVGSALDGADTPRSGDKPPLGRLWDWGGRLGATTLATNERLLFHGSLSRRSRFPALRELYSGALGRFVPNPGLRPELLTGGEVGLTARGGAGELQVVGFRQLLTGGIVRVSVTTPEGRKFQRVNQDEIRSTGVELLALGRLGPFSLSGDLTLQRVRGMTSLGEEALLEYEPEVAGKLGAALPLPWALEGWADLRYMGKQYCQNPEAGGLVSLDGSRRLDLGMRRSFQVGTGNLSRWQGAVSLQNATDGVVLDQCGLPQPGRTLRVQIRVW